MKKSILFMVLFLSFFCLFTAQSVFAISFNDIIVYDFVNGTAKIKWTTSEPTKGDIYYGEDKDNLNRYMGFSLYDYFHESVLYGLKKNNTYYYKIIARNQSGNLSESYIRSFKVTNMDDTINPEILKEEILQITKDAVSLSWFTNEETKAEIRYGNTSDNLNKKANSSKYSTEHELNIYSLKPNTGYYLQIISIDKKGNRDYGRVFHFTTNSSNTSHDLVITNIKPQGTGDNLVSFRNAQIQWNTNWISKGLVTYGTKSGKLSKKVYTYPNGGNFHVAFLYDLEPNTTYYFKIKAYDSLYNKSKETQEMTFFTKSISESIKTGSLVKGSNSKVYVIDGNNKYWIRDEKTFLDLGFKWNWIQVFSDEILYKYKETGEINNSKKHPNGTLIKFSNKATVYLIENGKKRSIANEQTFNKMGYDWSKIITLDPKKFKYSSGIALK